LQKFCVLKKINLSVNQLVTAVFLAFVSSTFAQSPTAPALGFNVFTEGNLTPKTNESEGPIAAGGDLNVDGNYSACVHSVGNFQVGGAPIGMLIQGKVNYVGGNSLKVLNNGYAKIGNGTGSNVWYFDQNNAASPIRITPNNNYNSTPRIELSANSVQLGVGVNNNPIFQNNLIDFASAFSTMRSNSTSISQCEHNVTIKNANGQVIPNTNLPNLE
jgi:choice-of-anchor A domain-containing protein